MRRPTAGTINIVMVSHIEGTSGLDRHQFETKQGEISLFIVSSKENT
jgi:hypothetical protein